MACAELFMMALVAALKKSNMTQEPIVMWLGNSSSQPRVIPWSSFNKSPGGAPRHSVAGNSSKGLHESRKHAMTSLSWHRSTTVAALQSHSRHPHSKKRRQALAVKSRPHPRMEMVAKGQREDIDIITGVPDGVGAANQESGRRYQVTRDEIRQVAVAISHR
ncbi:hypothetical protein MTO96_024090 [Rhipicephalus appendiculatus]